MHRIVPFPRSCLQNTYTRRARPGNGRRSHAGGVVRSEGVEAGADQQRTDLTLFDAPLDQLVVEDDGRQLVGRIAGNTGCP